MKMLQEILGITAARDAEIQQALKWIESDPWANLLHESSTKADPELVKTINDMVKFMQGDKS